MVERDESDEADDDLASAPSVAVLGESRLPAGLSGAWPVPRTPVLGTRAGLLAEIELVLVRGASGALARLPHAAQRAVVEATARIARRLDLRRTRNAREFLTQAFGPSIEKGELDARVLQAWRHLIWLAIRSVAFPRRVPTATIRDHYEVRMSDDVRDVLAAGRGCVIVTAHVGDWEAGAAILPWLGFDPLYAVAKPPRNRPLSVYMQRTREERGMRLLPRRGAMRHAGAIVEAGGTLVMLLDQRARTRPVYAPFFGRRARCDRSAGVLLRRLRCPIVFAACYATSRPYYYEAVFPAAMSPAEVAGLSPEAIATRINAHIEGMIRAHPEQYFWLHDRYRGDPPA